MAAWAGVICGEPREDYGLDLFLRGVYLEGGQYLDSCCQIDLQVKSTTRAEVSDTEIRYDLEVRTYDLLRRLTPVPSLLILYLLPSGSDWLEQSEMGLLLCGCAYWRSLRGAPATTNEATIRIAVPRANVFSAAAIVQMMDRLRQGLLL